MQDKTERTCAGFGPRAAAFVIDRLLVWLALGLVRVPAVIASLIRYGGLSSRAVLFQYSALDVACWVLSAAYFVLLTYFTGGTLGKKLMRLRVERADGEPLRFIDVLYRETVGRFLSGILCLGYFMVLADKENRAFHDWLCDTRVVYDEVSFSRRLANPAPSGTVSQSEPSALSPVSGYSIPGAASRPADTEKEDDSICS